ncbi:MAG: cyclic nucleotide-binding domain-containing protein [Acidobacteria bacterium]|nr:cyclic nucleotide-binding domain-containing protein [Acidobacteriota bacterium]
MISNEDFLQLFRQNSAQQHIPIHTQIFRQQEAVRDIYLLAKGLVKMTRVEKDGQETILDLRFVGSLLGATSALANEPAPMTAISVTLCEVYRLSVKEFLRLAQSDEAFWHELLKLVSRQRNEQVDQRAQQSTLDARSRLIRLLLLGKRVWPRTKRAAIPGLTP